MELRNKAGAVLPAPAAFSTSVAVSSEEASLLNILSRFFIAPPDDSLVHLLRNAELLEVLGALCEPLEFQTLLALLTRSDGELLEDLKLEYSRLFSVPGTSYVPPYESYYKDKWTIPVCTSAGGESAIAAQGLLYGDSTVAVNKLYAAEGLGPNRTFGELPDHVSLEVAFLAVLLERGQEAEQRSDFKTRDLYEEKQEQFLKNHLHPFCEKFSENLQKKAVLPLYPLLARALLKSLAPA